MAKKTRSKQSRPRNEERTFAIVAVVLCLILGSGFCALLYALNQRGESTAVVEESLPDSKPSLIAPDHPRKLVDFSLTDCTGRTVDRSELRGKILVVDFLFTSCSLTCPYVNGQMEQIQQLTTNDPNVRLVSITVDPRDDTPSVLMKYGQRFGANTNRWLFLTGDRDTVYRLIGTSFLSADTDDPFGYMPGDFSHTEWIAVVGPDGNLRGYFDGLNQNTAGAVVEEIDKLRTEKL